MRIFVNSADGYVGRAVCADLRKVAEVENKLFGTVENEEKDIEKGLLEKIGLKRLVSRKDHDLFLKDVLSCSLIVYDLHSANIEEIEAVLKHLKIAKLDHEITFVLISSVNVWARTKVQRVAIESEEGEEEEEEAQEDAEPKEVPTRPMELGDEDLIRRIPAPAFESWKYIEELALSLQSKEKVRTHVVAAGILYGNGETTFNELFKAGWLSQPPPPIALPGNNYIPCIHVRDVARLVRVLVVNKNASHYLVAVDVAHHTQAEIVQGIMNEMANGREVPMVPADELTWEYKDVMLLDLVMKPSAPMLDKEFQWWSRKGIVTNIRNVADEFCRWRNLRPIKMVAWGPPGAGTERLCAKVAERYLHENPPHFSVEDILQEILNDDSGRGAKLKRKLAKAAKKPGGKLPLKLRTKLIRDKLLKTARYRGYVLDGYPTSYEEAEALFFERVIPDGEDEPEEEDPLAPKDGDDEAEEEEEDEPEAAAADPADDDDDDDPNKPTRKLNALIVPDFAVVMQSSEANCRTRIFSGKAQGAAQEEEFALKLADFRKHNLAEDGSAGTSDFFEEVARVRVLHVDVDKSGEDNSFQAIRTYMESKGQFFNYLKSDQERAKEKEAEVAEAEAREDDAKRSEHEAEVAAEQAKRQQRLKEEAGRRQVIAEGEASLLESEALPLKQYLELHVVPTLANGISEVCKEMPEDPIEYLAQYLFAHAQDIAPQLAAEANAAASRR